MVDPATQMPGQSLQIPDGPLPPKRGLAPAAEDTGWAVASEEGPCACCRFRMGRCLRRGLEPAAVLEAIGVAKDLDEDFRGES